MIKLVLFDLDGVLLDAKHIHFKALNDAIRAVAGEHLMISEEEHTNIYDGRKTTEKLQMLTERKKLNPKLHSGISYAKQQNTQFLLKDVKPNIDHIHLMTTLKDSGYMIGVCSNSVRETVINAMVRTKLAGFSDIILSNEDVQNSKPHPEIYWKAMSSLGVLPEETVIIEDSPPGLLAAQRSGAKCIRVKDPYHVNVDTILPQITGEKMEPKWEADMNVLIPMAGAGSRFAEAGYTFPKPLIQVAGMPMIQLVVENLGVKANFIFVVQKDHRERYNLDTLLDLIAPGCKIVEVDGITEGAACTALLAREYIDNDKPLFFANSDQWVKWNPVEFFYNMQETDADGGIVTFKATHPKWSFADVDENGFVGRVAEKNPISDNATVGLYYWKHGSDFVKYADQMIAGNARVNGEFYVCPVFNWALTDTPPKRIKAFECEEMWGLGTPEDLEYFLRHHEDEK